MNFTQDEYSTPKTIEKMKILGAVLEPPDKQHLPIQPIHISNLHTTKLGQIGSAL